jgi:SAM-dependent methyltransferase
VDGYNLSNPGDKGSLIWAPSGFLDKRFLREQENDVAWSSKIIERFVDVKDKSVLSLRCLSGALPAHLKARGATVFAVDSFDSNIRYASDVRSVSNTLVLPFSEFHELQLPWHCRFSVIEALSIHLLAHVMQPRMLLARIFDVLKPGGYLFLDEKDVLLPKKGLGYFVLDSGPAHLYHLTRDTVAAYVRCAGFELVECQVDSDRMSDFQHIRTVARKPDVPGAVAFSEVFGAAPQGKAVLRKLKKLEWTAWLRAHRREIPGRSRRILKRIPGLRQAWRLSRRLVGQ